MSTSHALLGLLDRAPAHGYTLKHDYDHMLRPERPLAFGQVYSALARFERQGWAEFTQEPGASGPERKLYTITADGVSVVDEWVYAPQDAGQFASSTLFSRVSIALLSGRDPHRVLDAQRAQHLARMRELTAARRNADPGGRLAVDYQIAHLDADLRWIDEAVARLANAGPDGVAR